MWVFASTSDSEGPEQKFNRVKKSTLVERRKFLEQPPAQAWTTEHQAALDKLAGFPCAPNLRQMLDQFGSGDPNMAQIKDALYNTLYRFLCEYAHANSFPDDMLKGRSEALTGLEWGVAPRGTLDTMVIAASMLAWPVLMAVHRADDAADVISQVAEARSYFRNHL